MVLEWTQERPDSWASGPYVVRMVTQADGPKSRVYEVVGAPRDFVGERAHKTLAKAQGACASHAHLRESVDNAPPFSRKQQELIAHTFADSWAEKRLERQPHPTNNPPPRGLRKRRLPGAARPNDEVLADWEQKIRDNPIVRAWCGDPEDIFRWRLQFDCGCIEERLGRTDNPQSLLEVSDPNIYTKGDRLPPGEFFCSGEHTPQSFPLRGFASWGGFTRRLQEEDPVEVPEQWAFLGQDYCDRTRCTETHWVHDWRATLTCGHSIAVSGQDIDWTPDQVKDAADPEVLAKKRARFENDDNEFAQKMLAAGWPDLGTYRDCDLCPKTRKVVAYEPLGWLIPPPRKPRKQKSQKERLQAQIQRAEREAERLRAELKELG